MVMKNVANVATKKVKTNINDVFMIKGVEKNQGKWKIEITKNIFIGKGNTIRINTGKNVIENLYKLLYPTVTQTQLSAILKMVKHYTLILKNSNQTDQQLQ